MLTILWSREPDDSLIILNDYGLPTKIRFTSYKSKYFGLEDRKEFVEKYYIDGRIKLDYLMIDIKENLAIVNGRKV